MMKIEKNIPIPPVGGRPKAKYPFADMSVGDSVLIHGHGVDTHKATAYAHSVGRRNGWKFTSRGIMEDGRYIAVRIWRIE